MLRLKKILLVAGMLVAGLFAVSTVGTSSAQAGGFGYGGFYGHHHCYTPTYYAPAIHYVPSYHHHCYPSYGFGY